MRAGGKVKRLAVSLAWTVVACAGPMTSTAVLQDRGQDGGTVRINAPSYPPNADTQASAWAKMAEVCRPRSWMVVDITLQDLNGPRGVECAGETCSGGTGTRSQQVDLRFVCVTK